MSNYELCQTEQVHSLYSEHHSWLYAWLCKKLGCSHNAADIAQSTFVRLLASSSLPQINEPRGSLTTTNRLITDESRRKRIEQQYLENYYYYHGEQALAPASCNWV